MQIANLKRIFNIKIPILSFKFIILIFVIYHTNLIIKFTEINSHCIKGQYIN